MIKQTVIDRWIIQARVNANICILKYRHKNLKIRRPGRGKVIKDEIARRGQVNLNKQAEKSRNPKFRLRS